MISQQFIHENIIRFNANISRFLGKKENIYIKTWIDEILSFVLFGASPDDYFRYEFYRKSLYERNKFITYRRSKKIIKNYNSSDTVSNQLMCDKGKQNRHFKDFLRREWIDIDFCTNEQMTAFFKKHKRVIMKPKDGSGGKGIFILTEREFNDKGENLGAYTGWSSTL